MKPDIKFALRRALDLALILASMEFVIDSGRIFLTVTTVVGGNKTLEFFSAWGIITGAYLLVYYTKRMFKR